jgi:hypothetical protein
VRGAGGKLAALLNNFVRNEEVLVPKALHPVAENA